MSLKIGIGKILICTGSGSWTPKKIESKLLYWGKYSEITGGQMPNKVASSTDYLSVSGSVGSETYRTPNTTPYISADTDYIWFKTDASQRTTTTNELISYDFSRTFVRYDDATPYHFREIAILKNGEILTTEEENQCRNYFRLSLWWSGVLSLYGRLKGNRSSGKSTWTPEDVYDAASIALFARMLAADGVSQTNSRKTAIDTLIKTLKTNSLFDTRFDVFTVLRGTGEASTKLNWVKNSHNATLIDASTVTYTADVGYKRGAGLGGLNTNYKASTQKVLFAQNSASFLIKNNALTGSTTGHGVVGTAVMQINSGAGRGLNSSAINNLTGNVASYITDGLRGISRSASTEINCYKGIYNETLSRASNALPDYNAYILGQNNWGTFTAKVDVNEVVEFYALGASISYAEFLIIDTALNTYFSSF